MSAHVINGEYEQTLSPVYGYRCITVSPATVNDETRVSIASNTFHSRDHLNHMRSRKNLHDPKKDDKSIAKHINQIVYFHQTFKISFVCHVWRCELKSHKFKNKNSASVERRLY